MDARAKTVREILHAGDQYLIPFFQRYYSWKRKHWERLKLDLLALLEDPTSASQHFLGPLVCTPTDHVPGQVPAYQLIDGQQRLTTLTLLLTALRDVALEHGVDDLAEEVFEDYLVHKRRTDLERYKIVPRVGDREPLIAIVEGKIEAEHRQFSVYRAWRYFRKQISEWAEEDAAAKLRKLFVAVTGRMSLVVITIDGENPYEIFESLNSTGLPLEEADLIRNYLFMQVPIADQDAFNRDHWERLEAMFEATASGIEIPPTQFYRSYLMRDGTYCKANEVFIGFKDQNRRRAINAADQVAELREYLQYERLLRDPQSCGDPRLTEKLQQISTLEITTAHPLLMNLFARRDSGEIDEATLLGCMDDLASFALRRSICGESTRTYGIWFVEAIATISDDPRGDLRKYWMRRGWPDDPAFIKRLQEFPLYRREKKKCRLVLSRLEESYGHKEKVDPSTLSIEHVLPRAINRGRHGKAWQAMLGQDWKSIHETHLDTIGNLTLTGYNPDLSNKPFPDKKIELIRSNLLLNKWFTAQDSWNAETIEERGRQLSQEVAKLWPRPAGGDYALPINATPTKKLSAAERQQFRLEYWGDLLSLLAERNHLPKLPKPSRRGWLMFPFGIPGFRLGTYMVLNKRSIGVQLLCRGPKGKAHFAKLREQREAIESELDDQLLWQEMPHQQASHISRQRTGVSPLDQDAWLDQHKWFADQLEQFYDVFAKYCAQIAPKTATRTPLRTIRKRFWTTHLERASAFTDLHVNRAPRNASWISTGAGHSGLRYVYILLRDSTGVELYIDFGKGQRSFNKQLFEALEARKSRIETLFGEPLEWERLDNKRACRIIRRFHNGGAMSDEADWLRLQEEMIDGMVRLEKALAPHIRDLDALLGND